MKVNRLENVFCNPPLPDGDYVLLSEAQAEIDSHKKVIKSQGKTINAYCKKIGELNEDTERTIAEKVEQQAEIARLKKIIEIERNGHIDVKDKIDRAISLLNDAY